jgi:hypothetical protein
MNPLRYKCKEFTKITHNEATKVSQRAHYELLAALVVMDLVKKGGNYSI